ncbi:unnamed protein product [Aphanomyces euteiches]|uniref:HECT-type E3 ubiquitin transferase n=1 Tax=Aphanomyces euteiches TaxID=100861 RepID=A0A6G0XUP3_9STRA|nr:hypothetical protein Ae201684_001314 [Aphanomyces euteiches]KAH9099598.1 hypothetical protein Ae201684P_018611 [Aphanomyces euteiches]KAH9139633.1 hypothetical protein AeRB84_016110 [Aphanomyces euteiches]
MRVFQPAVGLAALALAIMAAAQRPADISPGIVGHDEAHQVPAVHSGEHGVGYQKTTRVRRTSHYRHAPYAQNHRQHRQLNERNETSTTETIKKTRKPSSTLSEAEKHAIEAKLSAEMVAFGVVILVGVALYYNQLRSYDQLRAQDDPMQFLHGLRREDMEDIALEALKWQCTVCAFHNQDQRVCCSLCDSKRDTNIAVVDMTFQQKSARARNQWRRHVDDTGTVDWVESDKPVYKGPHYIAAAKMETSENEWSLSLEPLSSANATRAVDGADMPTWWLHQLQELSAQSFSLKYAWLLTQISHSYKGYFKMKVYREKIIEESLEILMIVPPDRLCTMTRIEFLGESGIDAGGVLREWYSQLTQTIFEPSRGLFIAANKAEQSYWINPESAIDHGPNQLRHFQAIGRLLGGAIVNGQVLPFHLSLPLFKILVGTPLSFEDVQHLDLNVYNSLVFIRDTDNVDDLALDFSYTTTKHELVDLVPNGRNIPVTLANRDEYVDCMVRYLLLDQVRPQVEALVRGMNEVVPPELLLPFDHKEFELLVCGFSLIDVADWRTSTIVSTSMKKSKCIHWFWDILEHELTDSDRAKLLRFVTGSSRVPLQGFKGLTSYDGNLCPFTIQAVAYTRGAFPKAHSCFNRIDLPIYPTRELLHEALIALVNLESTEFTLE